jgi:hypothetical protein
MAKSPKDAPDKNPKITPEMVAAGAEAVCGVIGEEPPIRGEPERIAKAVYRAMHPLAKSR